MITYLGVSGTGASWEVGYPAETGFALTDPALIAKGECFGKPFGKNWNFQGVGYPAAVFPMRPSVLQGWDEVVRLLLEVWTSGKFVLSGYSQGALVVCLVWLHEILNPQGRLHHRLNDCLGIFTYGNPMRAPGIAYGNTLLWGHDIPGEEDGHVTGGIAGPANLTAAQCLFPEGHFLAGQPAVFDFANPGDIYAAAPVGKGERSIVGEDMSLIFENVMDFNGQDLLAWAQKLFEIIFMPWEQFWPLCQAIWNGIRFFAAGMDAPHWRYDSAPLTRYLDQLGRQYA